MENNSEARITEVISDRQLEVDLQNPRIGPQPPCPAALRAVGRPDSLTAQRVEVGIVFQSMLSTREAAQYLAANEVPLDVAVRVLTRPHLRRGW